MEVTEEVVVHTCIILKPLLQQAEQIVTLWALDERKETLQCLVMQRNEIPLSIESLPGQQSDSWVWDSTGWREETCLQLLDEGRQEIRGAWQKNASFPWHADIKCQAALCLLGLAWINSPPVWGRSPVAWRQFEWLKTKDVKEIMPSYLEIHNRMSSWVWFLSKCPLNELPRYLPVQKHIQLCIRPGPHLGSKP